MELSFTQKNPKDGEDIEVNGFRRGRAVSIFMSGNL
jgi:S-adenosylmethionine synthetase